MGDEAREVIGEVLKEEFNEKFLIQKLKKEEVEEAQAEKEASQSV